MTLISTTISQCYMDCEHEIMNINDNKFRDNSEVHCNKEKITDFMGHLIENYVMEEIMEIEMSPCNIEEISCRVLMHVRCCAVISCVAHSKYTSFILPNDFCCLVDNTNPNQLEKLEAARSAYLW